MTDNGASYNAMQKWTATVVQPTKGGAMKEAKLMWDAYAVRANGKTFDGKPLPTWDELGEDRQSCWIAAASVSADRIETLQKQIGILFVANVRLNSRADLDSDGQGDLIEKLEALLHDASEFLDNYSDVIDGLDGQPEANYAMILKQEIDRVLENKPD